MTEAARCSISAQSVADNVEFVSSFASYLQIIDAIDRDPSVSESRRESVSVV